ncbi:hypothetical protein EJ04DRAFT_138172 [Polyplosphaeria fusca]|uniref:Uncharacterized protein n=1 Tax=Polyplosphaeria fusca TaxID=682080 RepID=A0A9P4QKJ4_9PLEO|nr:hypothetical protein EJ04DRAFT_138172 [Polyplosphaeria fusca]
MPRGRLKRRHESDESDSAPDPEPKRPKKAPQSAPHRRGGIHRVNDENRTGTVWDTLSHKDLMTVIRAPDRVHLYYKDMKKAEMIKRLAKDDAKRAQRQARIQKENQQKKADAKKKKQKEEQEKQEMERIKAQKAADKARRQAEKEAAGEEVSEEDTSRTGSSPVFGLGEFLDDDSWESSTESATPTASTLSPLHPAPKLRILEWPFPELPSTRPLDPRSPSISDEDEDNQEPLPIKIPYTAMNLVTTTTNETLELPGRTQPVQVGADFVPRPSLQQAAAVRNGILTGVLRDAIIERGRDWAQRTRVQGWNARLYMRLPQRTSAVPLADVYKKWREKRKGDTRTFESRGGGKARGRGKLAQDKGLSKQEEKKRMMLDIYASSEYRPPICYIPAYLDYPRELDPDVHRNIKSLYYIRFKRMDLPMYYFWANPKEWRDPTKENPEWKGLKELDVQEEQADKRRRQQLIEEAKKTLNVQPHNPNDSFRPFPLDRTRARVKRASTPRKLHPSYKRPKTMTFNAKVLDIERELYEDGVAAVLHGHRSGWLTNGRQGHWEYLIDNLPTLYPSGKLPDAPPVHIGEVPTSSLAEKIAAIDALDSGQPFSPINGDEPWTRDDDAFWDIVELPDDEVEIEEADVQRELLRSVEPLDFSKISAKRRGSRAESLPRNLEEFDEWLQNAGPSNEPPETSATTVENGLRIIEREAWEELFEQRVLASAEARDQRWKERHPMSTIRRTSQVVPDLISQIESMPVAELKWQIYTLMDKRLRNDRCCHICLEPLDKTDLPAIHGHYQSHRDEADSRCPFCGLEWSILNSQWKAFHIHEHDWEDGLSLYRRLSSDVVTRVQPSRKAIQISSVLPTPLRRKSKVTFAPTTVERRIPYNDRHDPGMDADVSSMAATSPKKSNLKQRRAISNNTGRRLSLHIDTEINNTKKKRVRGTRKGKVKASSEGSSDSGSLQKSRLTTRRRSNDAWDPAGEPSSGSDHVPSPVLPQFPHYAPDDPKATFHPRRLSSYSTDSLESPAKVRKAKPKKTGTKKAAQTTKARGRSKQAAGVKKPSSHVQRKQPPSFSALSEVLPGLEAQRPGTIPHRDSTISNASSGSSERRATELTLFQYPPPERTTPRKGSSSSRSSKGRRGSKAADVTSDDALYRRASAGLSSDFIPFTDEAMPNVLADEDRMTGNPFAAPPKKAKSTKKNGKAKAATKRTIAKTKQVSPVSPHSHASRVTKPKSPRSPKSPTLKERALAVKSMADELRARKADSKKTISGRSFVEPLLVAPAQRLFTASKEERDRGRRSSNPSPASDRPVPTTSSTRRATSPTVKAFHAFRGSPKPESGLMVKSPTKSTSPTTPASSSRRTSKASRSSSVSTTTAVRRLASAAPSKTKRMSNASEGLPIVPPNTPAPSLGMRIRVDEGSGSELDAGQLIDKIGKVKTTRGGLVREVTAVVARGRGMSVVNKDGIAGGRGAKKKGLLKKHGEATAKKDATKKTALKADNTAKHKLGKAKGKMVEEVPSPKGRVTRAASKAKVETPKKTSGAKAKFVVKSKEKKVASGRVAKKPSTVRKVAKRKAKK